MSRIRQLNTLAAGLVLGALGTGLAQAGTANPFASQELSGGYQQLAAAEGKCGEGKCGEGKCGEGKCGEGKCGEGKCGDAAPGKSGDGKSGEGKCGEGKCGNHQ